MCSGRWAACRRIVSKVRGLYWHAVRFPAERRGISASSTEQHVGVQIIQSKQSHKPSMHYLKVVAAGAGYCNQNWVFSLRLVLVRVRALGVWWAWSWPWEGPHNPPLPVSCHDWIDQLSYSFAQFW